MSARAFTHPDFGKEARVEVWGREVRLIFVAGTEAKAESLAEGIVEQLKAGVLHLTMMGKPTGVVETRG
ncbi:MAG TPA: hypothetical protein VKW08_08080 [Xanthobacteraceae bacterium]|jgi:hypothetical protein|nr:hypothetical protein [Xanthobacteraceae bacterium]